ncbi:MAG: DUF1194 domain-containing protein [Bosea sp. (in: a-proteobacteria)]
MRRLLLTLLLAFLAVFPTPPVRSQEPVEVDLALVLAVDISYSMDMDELALQRSGYVEAFRSKQVHEAIERGAVGRIAVAYFEWAGVNVIHNTMDWIVLDTAADANAFADRLAEAPIRRGRRTSISGAIDTSMDMLAKAPVRPLRRVIDISGDGPNNDGRVVTVARDEALDKGIGINGLPIMLKSPGYLDINNLEQYYQDCVIGGVGAFVVPVRERHQLADAVRTKLVREIATAPDDAVRLIQKAQASGPRTNCAIGERLMRERFGN